MSSINIDHLVLAWKITRNSFLLLKMFWLSLCLLETRCPVACWFKIVCCALEMLLSWNIIIFEIWASEYTQHWYWATVKTNLIINLVMFFGIPVYLPTNFDGICRPTNYPMILLYKTFDRKNFDTLFCHNVWSNLEIKTGLKWFLDLSAANQRS